jgi:hypothetical protein
MENKWACRAFLGIVLGLLGLFMLPGGVLATATIVEVPKSVGAVYPFTYYADDASPALPSGGDYYYKIYCPAPTGTIWKLHNSGSGNAWEVVYTHYWIDGNPFNYFIRADFGNPPTGGITFFSSSWGNMDCGDKIYIAYSTTAGDLNNLDIPNPPPTDVMTLDFLQPLDEASTPDFSNYLLNYQYYTGTTTPVSLLFSVNAYSEAGTFYGNSWIIESVVPDSTTTKSVFIPKTFAFLQNNWYNVNGSMALTFPGTILATSTSHFIVSTTSSAIWEFPPTSTTTSAGFVLTCDPDSGFFQESLCHLALFLFIPKYEDFSQFQITWDDIKTKAPLGYLTSAITSLSGLNTEAEASFSFSSLGEFTDNIHDFFVSAFWLLFLFWTFNRIRHLEI